MTQITEQARSDAKKIAYYQQQADYADNNKIVLFDIQNAEDQYHLDDKLYFERHANYPTDWTLIKEVFNADKLTLCDNKLYAFIEYENKYADPAVRGKFRLEIPTVRTDEEMEENPDLEWVYPKCIGHFDTVGEAMAVAVQKNHPSFGQSLN